MKGGCCGNKEIAGEGCNTDRSFMTGRIVNCRYLDALLKLILFSALVHIVILVIHAVRERDFSVMNYFNILDLDFFFPGIEEGVLSNVLSVVVMVVIYGVMFWFGRGGTGEK